MASIAQGVLAGQLATGLTALPPFIAALQAISANGSQVVSLNLTLANGGAAVTGPSFTSPAPLSVSDSATLANALATLFGELQAEWTNQLTAI